MKQITRTITTFLFILILLILPGCSVFYRDCTKLVNDPAAYRQCQASQGSEQAQYELGREAYEAKDYKTALKWLKMAAAVKPARTAVYMPPVGGQSYGTVLMMDTATGSSGHRGALSLLAEMYQRGLGVKIDSETANRYRERADKAPMTNVKPDE